jgi:hypothetical protein
MESLKAAVSKVSFPVRNSSVPNLQQLLDNMIIGTKLQSALNLQLLLRLQRQCQGTAHLKWMNVDGLMLGQEIEWMTSTGTVCLGRLPGPWHMITHLDLRKVATCRSIIALATSIPTEHFFTVLRLNWFYCPVFIFQDSSWPWQGIMSSGQEAGLCSHLWKWNRQKCHGACHFGKNQIIYFYVLLPESR